MAFWRILIFTTWYPDGSARFKISWPSTIDVTPSAATLIVFNANNFEDLLQ